MQVEGSLESNNTAAAPDNESQSDIVQYRTRSEVEHSVRKFRVMAYVMFTMPIVAMLATLLFSLMYKPQTRDILFNHFDALYRLEDLSKATTSEGEVKQLATNWVSTVFSYDHVSFADAATYDEYISGKRSSSLPDHRDKIRPYFSEGVFPQVVKDLEIAPWMGDFRTQRRRNVVSFYSPPTQEGQDASLQLEGNRLFASYKGYFYLGSYGYRVPERLFRVDFNLKLERKPNNVSPASPGYFFAPMVPDNYSEWRISEFNWSAKRDR